MDENSDILFLNYNLRTNKFFTTEFKSLKYLCTLATVAKAFKSYEVLRDLTSELIGHEEERSDKIFTIIENELVLEYLPNFNVKVMLLTIRLVYYEIKSFIPFIRNNDKILFLRNIVFNDQGAINPRETVLRVLKNEELSIQEKFEICCLYSFDEHLIESFFTSLTPDTRNYYFNLHIQIDEITNCLFWYWVRIFTSHLQRPANIEVIANNDYYKFHVFRYVYIASMYHNGDGVQYLYQNHAPSRFIIRHALEFHLENNTQFPSINTLMYLLCKLMDVALIKRCAYSILINLAKNPRWHLVFIRYYKILRNRVNAEYTLRLFKVILKIIDIIRIEGFSGKYCAILKNFINLIPEGIKFRMSRINERKYALLIFLLYSFFQDVVMIYPLLSIYELGNEEKIYLWAEAYFIEYAYAFRNFSYSSFKRFLKELIRSKTNFFKLMKLYLRLNPLSYLEVHYTFWEVTRHFIKRNSNICIVAEKTWRKWPFLYLKNGEIANLLLPSSFYALRKVKYAEQFLSSSLNGNLLEIYYRNRIVIIINVEYDSNIVPQDSSIINVEYDSNIVPQDSSILNQLLYFINFIIKVMDCYI